LPAETKVVATVAFVAAVVATPAHAVWVLALDAVIVVGVMAMAGLPRRVVFRRLRIEAPFLAFAVLLPVVGGAPRVDVLGVRLSEPGLWAAWNIGAKGTLGVLAALVLTASTPVVELVAGLERLRVPRVFTAIAGFMVRYLDVIVGEANRTRIARLSRADDPRWLWQVWGVATSAGSLFVRSFERGERVHLAMLSRGFTGALPPLHDLRATSGSWMRATAVPALAFGLMALGRTL
jgi:cobalt/nickel transport system permease protein